MATVGLTVTVTLTGALVHGCSASLPEATADPLVLLTGAGA